MAASINPKVAAGVLGGAIVTTGAGIAEMSGHAPTAVVTAGATTIVSFVLAWLIPERLWDRAPIVEDMEDPLVDPVPIEPTDVG